MVAMKINLITAGAFLAALALPLGVSAQQAQPPGVHAQNRVTPSHARLSHRWMKRLGGLNLSGDQQQRIQSMIDQYSQAHPAGSPRDPNASRLLRHNIMGVLSSDQLNQYRQQMHAHRAQMQQRGQAQGQYQGPQDQQPQYGDPRYQQQPPDQGAQPDQGPDQGPPGDGPPDQQPPA